MTRRYLILFVLGLGVTGLAAAFQPSPGYMDADYYLMGGLQLAGGKGFTDPVLWNYLSDPPGLPYPSHAYWMPLTSLLAAAGLWLAPFDGPAGARFVFLILAGCVPPMTARLAWELFSGRGERARREAATLAGLLAAFPGFYLAFLSAPDAFAVYMLAGALFFRLAGSEWKAKWLALGGIAGVMHLARADGAIWLGVGLVGALGECGLRHRKWAPIGSCLGGYLLVMAPWFARNFFAFGAMFAPGAVRTLWLLSYDELFAYPASLLTFERWWAAGLGEIVRARVWALGENLQTALGVQGQVFLLPLIAAGLWKLRKQRAVQWGGLGWGLTLAAMTLAFPFAGARGGFFHSGAAVQPLLWAAAPAGLEAFVAWGGRVRGWHLAQARRVFGAGLVGLAALMTGLVFATRALPAGQSPGYAEVEQELAARGAQLGEVVMVNNPPGYFLASGRPAVVIPNGDVSTLLAVAERYGARFVVLDGNAPEGLRPWLEAPAAGEGLVYLGTLGEFRLFEVAR